MESACGIGVWNRRIESAYGIGVWAGQISSRPLALTDRSFAGSSLDSVSLFALFIAQSLTHCELVRPLKALIPKTVQHGQRKEVR